MKDIIEPREEERFEDVFDNLRRQSWMNKTSRSLSGERLYTFRIISLPQFKTLDRQTICYSKLRGRSEYS
ncbi:hypothetical protein Bca101_044392 [Brassica carinata]